MSEAMKRVVTCQECKADNGISVYARRKRIAYLRCRCGHKWRIYDTGETITAILVCLQPQTAGVV